MFWVHDRMHWPDPIPVAMMSLLPEKGVNAAAARYDAPIRFQARRINTYQYSCFEPPMVPPEELEAMGKRAEEKIGAAMRRFDELWQGEWLPEVKRHLDYWRAFDLAGATPAD